VEELTRAIDTSSGLYVHLPVELLILPILCLKRENRRWNMVRLLVITLKEEG
jgi:hypothetical protein